MVLEARAKQGPSLKQAGSSRADRAESPLSPSNECPKTPPPLVHDKDYGHGFSINSMIVTHYVPVLVERSTNARTGDDDTHQMGFIPNAPFRPEPVKRREDGSTTPLLMGEGLFNPTAANTIVEGCIPFRMIVEARSRNSNEKNEFIKVGCKSTSFSNNSFGGGIHEANARI